MAYTHDNNPIGNVMVWATFSKETLYPVICMENILSGTSYLNIIGFRNIKKFSLCWPDHQKSFTLKTFSSIMMITNLSGFLKTNKFFPIINIDHLNSEKYPADMGNVF